MIEMQTRANTEVLAKELDKLFKRGENLEPVMGEIANLLENTVEEAFEQKVDPMTGTPWQALEDITIKRKQSKNYKDPSRPLFASGEMQGSLLPEHDSTSATIGLNVKSAKGYPYPIVHQYGTTKAGRSKNITIPARPFFPIDDDNNLARHVEDEILDILEEHFTI